MSNEPPKRRVVHKRWWRRTIVQGGTAPRSGAAVTSFLFAAMVLLESATWTWISPHRAAAAAHRRRPFSRRDAALRRLGLMERPDDCGLPPDSAAGGNGGALAYMPAYVIPEGSPVDPCVTCRPRWTTMCRKIKNPCGRSVIPSTVCTAMKRRCPTSTAAVAADDDNDDDQDQLDSSD